MISFANRSTQPSHSSPQKEPATVGEQIHKKSHGKIQQNDLFEAHPPLPRPVALGVIRHRARLTHALLVGAAGPASAKISWFHLLSFHALLTRLLLTR